MSHSPQPLTWQEMRDAVIAKFPQAYYSMGTVWRSLFLNQDPLGMDVTEPDSWASAYARLFPSAAVSIPSVDWGDDEKVVRGRWPEAYQGNNKKSDYVWATEGSRIAWLRSSDNSPMKEVAGFLGHDWPSARQHPTVQDYERKWNPEHQGGTDAPATEIAERLDGQPVDENSGHAGRDIGGLAGNTAAQEVAERGAFEKWAKTERADLRLQWAFAGYADPYTRNAWSAWQARASLDTRGETQVCATCGHSKAFHADGAGYCAYPERHCECDSFEPESYTTPAPEPVEMLPSEGMNLLAAEAKKMGARFSEGVKAPSVPAASTSEPVEAGDEPLDAPWSGEFCVSEQDGIYFIVHDDIAIAEVFGKGDDSRRIAKALASYKPAAPPVAAPAPDAVIASAVVRAKMQSASPEPAKPSAAPVRCIACGTVLPHHWQSNCSEVSNDAVPRGLPKASAALPERPLFPQDIKYENDDDGSWYAYRAEDIRKYQVAEQEFSDAQAALLAEAQRERDEPAISDPTPAGWRCFHCEFYTTDRLEAEAHFGDRDDAEEFKPICKWWSNMDDQERKEQFQEAQKDLGYERMENYNLNKQLAAMTVRAESTEVELAALKGGQ